MEEAFVKLIAGPEKKELKVQKQIAMQSKLLQKIIEDNGIDEPIPLEKIKYEILEKIIQYCEIHVDCPPTEIQIPLKTKEVKDLVDPEEFKLINTENLTELCEMIAGANLLDIEGLVDLASLQVGKLMATKQPEDIRKCFGIENEFTKDEIEDVLKENPWLRESSSSSDDDDF